MKTLVLLHGCGLDAHAFDPLVPHLAGVRVMTPSYPGRRGSPGDPLGSVAKVAAWVRHSVDVVGAVVAGHSFGGAVAIELALSTEIAGLVLMNTGARLRVHPDILEQHRAVAARGDDGDVPASTTYADWLATNAFDRMQDIARIGVPTLVLGGTDDVLTPPKYARFLHERIAGSRLEILDGAGHDLPMTQPAAAGRIISEWIAAAVPAPRAK